MTISVSELTQLKNRLNQAVTALYSISSAISTATRSDMTGEQISNVTEPLTDYLADTISKIDDTAMDLGIIIDDVKEGK